MQMQLKRLRGRNAFDRLFKEGRRVDQGCIRLVYLVDKKAEPAAHVAFICPADRYSAVRRNRVKRLMREVVMRDREGILEQIKHVDGGVLLALVFRGARGISADRLKMHVVRKDVAAVCKRMMIGRAP